MKVTYAWACEEADLETKKTNDDRNILRREVGVDFLSMPANGRAVCDRDDVVALIFYAQQRSEGQPVKVAGLNASRIRDAMCANPEADQLTIVTQTNGNHFTLPTDSLDLSSGYHSGGHILSATMVDVRNLRDRVQRAYDAYEPVIGTEDEAA